MARAQLGYYDAHEIHKNQKINLKKKKDGSRNTRLETGTFCLKQKSIPLIGIAKTPAFFLNFTATRGSNEPKSFQNVSLYFIIAI